MNMPLQVMELEDPLEDQIGYVYDRRSILDLLKKSRGPVRCPVQGKAREGSELLGRLRVKLSHLATSLQARHI